MAPRRPTPTAIQRAIEEGYPRAPTSQPLILTPNMGSATMGGMGGMGGGTPMHVNADDEHSVPIGMSYDDEIRYRLRELAANDLDLGRGLGELRNVLGEKLTEIATILKSGEERARAKDAAEIAAAASREAAAITAAASRSAAESALNQEHVKAQVQVNVNETQRAVARWTAWQKIAITALTIAGTVITALAGHAILK